MIVVSSRARRRRSIAASRRSRRRPSAWRSGGRSRAATRVAGSDAGVDPDPRSRRACPSGRSSRASGRSRGRDPRPTGGPRSRGGSGGRPGRGREDALRQRVSRGEPELLPDDVDARHELGHAVLDLEPGVDLEEPEAASRRTGTAVAAFTQPAAAARPDGHLVELPALVLGQPRRRRLLDELLVATLEGAVPLAERDDRARRVTEELDLDVAGRPDLPARGRRHRRRMPRPPRGGAGGSRRGQLDGRGDSAPSAPSPPPSAAFTNSG